MACITDRAFAELSAREWHDIVRLRMDVFVVEQECPYPELDGRDTEPATRHCWVPGSSAGRPELPVVAYARGLDKPGGGTKIGRVVTHPAARQNGLGGLLVNHLVQTTSGPWTLDAQARLADWYAGLGFSPAGEPFDDWGMLHVPMRLDVRAHSMPTDQPRRAGRLQPSHQRAHDG